MSNVIPIPSKAPMPCPTIERLCAESLALIHVNTKDLTRFAKDRHYEQCQAVKEAAARAYAEELVPAILGGSWMVAGGICAKNPAGLMPSHRRYMGPLFDHPIVLRSRGARGKLTWRDAAVVGMPYRLVSNKGAFRDDARELAECLAFLGVGVWARRDLSTHFPGHSWLVVAAPGLVGMQAWQYGFRKVK